MPEYEIDNVYDILHSRKGRFHLKVSKINEKWIEGTIVEGVADAMMDYNIKREGDFIIIRKELIRSATRL